MRAPRRPKGQATRVRPYLARAAKGDEQPIQEAEAEVESTPQSATPHEPLAASNHTLSSTGVQVPTQLPVLCEWCYNLRAPEKMMSSADVPASCSACVRYICRSCFANFMMHSLADKWQGFRCFRCNSVWNDLQIVRVLGQEEYGKHLERLTHRGLEQDPQFRWCAHEKCTSGQLYGDEVNQDPKICCTACGSVNCFKCRNVYHHGISCEQFQDPDLRKHKALRDTKTTRAMREDDTRRCPGCGSGIERISGCNHVHCRSPNESD